MNQEKFLSILGWVATATAMAMYISYIPQIGSNLAGHKGLAAANGGRYQLHTMGGIWLCSQEEGLAYRYSQPPGDCLWLLGLFHSHVKDFTDSTKNG